MKEALPLPLIVVQRLEEAVVSDPCEDGLGTILAMTWGSLQWSDIQAMPLDSVILGDCWHL